MLLCQIHLSLHRPVGDVVLLHVEVDAYLHHGQPALHETLGVLPEVYLPHGGGGVLVELQLEEIEVRGGAEHHVNAAARRAHLHVHVVVEDGEYDVHHLLVVALRVGSLAVGHGLEVCLEHAQCPVHVAMAYQGRHLGYGGGARHGVGADVARQQTAVQAHAYLLVWYVEGVEVGLGVVALDGDVAALVEQRYD